MKKIAQLLFISFFVFFFFGNFDCYSEEPGKKLLSETEFRRTVSANGSTQYSGTFITFPDGDPYPNLRNLNQLKVGMTFEDVEKITGRFRGLYMGKKAGIGDYVFRERFYAGPDKSSNWQEVWMEFKNKKLQSWGTDFKK